MYTPALHPEMLHKQLNRSFSLYKTVFPHVFLLSLLLSLVVFIPNLTDILLNRDIFFFQPFFSPVRLWLLLIDLVAFTLFAAMLWRVKCFVYANHEPIKQDLRIGFKKLPYIFLASLLQFIIIFLVGLVAVVFYGILYEAHLLLSTNQMGAALTSIVIILQFIFCIYLFFLFYFYLPLIVFENNGVISSLTKSASLVYGHWWKTFWMQITPWAAYLLFLILFKAIFNLNFNIYFISPTRVSLIATIVHILLFAIFLPWVASVMFVQIRDLEIRKKIHDETIRTDPIRV